MKRSKMIDAVEARLVSGLCFSFTREEIGQILDILEEAGMQPPISPSWEWTSAPWNKGSYSGFTLKYNWEKENGAS